MAVGFSDGTSYDEEGDWLARHVASGTKTTEKQQNDTIEINQNSRVGDFWSRFPSSTSSGMPPEATEKLTDALKVEGASRVAESDPTTENRGVLDKLTGRDGGERYQTWPERFLRESYEALKLPGDAWQGKIDPSSTQGMEKVFNLAGLMVGGPMPVASKLADGTLGSFAGVKSKTVDKKMLYKAQEMEMMEGRFGDDVWEQTGFFRGADNRWRYEIPDNTSKLKTDDLHVDKTIVDNPTGWTSASNHGEVSETLRVRDNGRDMFGKPEFPTRLPHILDHPELYEAYPHLKATKILPMPEGSRSIGFARPWDNEIYMSPMAPAEFKNVLHHEIQHIIQEHEGFAKGGNDQMFTPKELPAAQAQFEKAKEAFKKDKKDDYLNYKGTIEAEVNGNLEKFEPKLAEAIRERIQEAKDKGVYEPIKNIIKSEKLLAAQREKQYEQYMRLMGEVEARNVSLRSEMDWMERNYKSPMSTESRPRQIQITGRNDPVKMDAMSEEPTQFRRGANENRTYEDLSKELESLTGRNSPRRMTSEEKERAKQITVILNKMERQP